MMRIVILESPYAGDVEKNIEYARRCVGDCIAKGEYPVGLHLSQFGSGIADGIIPADCRLGVDKEMEWRKDAQAAVFYVDNGWSSGMMSARSLYEAEGLPYEIRTLGEWEKDGEGVRGTDACGSAGTVRCGQDLPRKGEYAS